MTQRKPTDKEIEEMYSHVTDNVEPEGTPALLRGQWNQVVDLMQKAAKWARDYDPWYYVSDGELPELEEDQNGMVKSDWHQIVKCVDGEWDFAALYKHGENNYNWEFMNIHEFEDGKADCGDLHKVICFMPIPQPQK